MLVAKNPSDVSLLSIRAKLVIETCNSHFINPLLPGFTYFFPHGFCQASSLACGFAT